MCLKLQMYSHATFKITKLKGKNEYMHSRAKIHLFIYLFIYFFHIFEQNCRVHFREYT